ncbi:MAG: methyltransferase domain-containing protein [Nanoarchaeota archaeon]
MAKILITKGKKEFVKELNRKISIDKPRKYMVNDISKDFHCKEGIVSKKDLNKKDGSKIKTSLKKEFTLLTADFSDFYRRIKRGAQIVSLKDIGLIIAETGVNQNSKIVDSGAGSGALSCLLAHICKEVTTYEIREDFIEIVKKNKESLELKNLKIKNKDIYKGIDEKNVDVITLDLPEPWKVLTHAKKALKAGGYLVSYSPTIPQVIDFVNSIDEHFIHLKTLELIKREWEIEGRKVRPITTQNVHTGFLSFLRKI